jgi:hypothetical protein
LDLSVRLLLVLSFFFTSMFHVSANLGDNESQLIKHFGARSLIIPTAKLGLKYQDFTSDGFSIEVTLMHGISESEIYSSPHITETQIQRLLRSNAQGHHWKELKSTDPESRAWKRDDGGEAGFGGLSLIISSKIYADKANGKS